MQRLDMIVPRRDVELDVRAWDGAGRDVQLDVDWDMIVPTDVFKSRLAILSLPFANSRDNYKKIRPEGELFPLLCKVVVSLKRENDYENCGRTF